MPFETVTHLPLAPGNFCDMLGRLELQYLEEFGPESTEVADVVALRKEFHCPPEWVPVTEKGGPEPTAAVDAATSNGRPRTEIYLAIVRRRTAV